MLGNFFMLLLSSADFFQNDFFKKNLLTDTPSEFQTVWIQSGFKLFAKVISRQQKLPLARKELLAFHLDCFKEARMPSLATVGQHNFLL